MKKKLWSRKSHRASLRITFVRSQETWLITTKIPFWPYPESWTLSQVDNNSTQATIHNGAALLGLQSRQMVYPGYAWLTPCFLPWLGCSQLFPPLPSIKPYQQISEQGQGGGCTTTSSYFILAKFEKKP